MALDEATIIQTLMAERVRLLAYIWSIVHDPYGSDLDAHKVLLSNGVTIIEGVNLENVEQGKYTLFCMPLRIPDMEAAPARAFLYPE